MSSSKIKKVKPYFVSAEVEVSGGGQAAGLLKQKNDREFYSDKEGITKVDRRRWNEAQHYEKKTWMELNRGAIDDRNQLHQQNFNNYEALPKIKFENVIELGCGPFTNLRLILKKVRAKKIDLLDPLLNDYLQHPMCTYSSGKMRSGYRRYKIGSTFNSSIEEFRPDKKYDLVVIINVLEHCFDTPKIFEQITNMLKPGGYIIFNDKLYGQESINPKKIYDAGHPIRIRQEVLSNFLSKNFSTEYKKIVREKDVDVPLIYFIGRKK